MIFMSYVDVVVYTCLGGIVSTQPANDKRRKQCGEQKLRDFRPPLLNKEEEHT